MTVLPASIRFDTHMMAIALRMAERGLGTTAFNPSVGAVIADEAAQEVIARGWTQPGGRPHAEKEALARAGGRARGKTMYVTIEPCAHTGRVPTCADAVLASGLSRVVCAQADPNPVIAGSGFAQLRDAGIRVDVGLCEAEARALTLAHILYVTRKRPFVQLKLAVSADGRIAPGNGAPVWITGPEARAMGHLLRARADTLITGVGTVLADDPALTCRLPGLQARSPHRIVLDTHGRTPQQAKVRAETPSQRTVIVSGHATQDLAGLLARLVTDTTLTTRRVLVEAGPTVSRAFLEAGLVDEVVLFSSPRTLGSRGSPALGDWPVPATFERPSDWTLVDHRVLGADQLRRYRRI